MSETGRVIDHTRAAYAQLGHLQNILRLTANTDEHRLEAIDDCQRAVLGQLIEATAVARKVWRHLHEARKIMREWREDGRA